MKIQKGQVQYKDRDDYFVTYGITDDGKQYYFIDKDVSELKNGNRVATTVLVEAIDEMVKASNVGVISASGVEVIPFNNRRIKPINDDVLLVEVSEPVDQNVKDAIASKNDPQAATTLVSATTTVKDKINAKMGGEGRFVFNDLFSEATVCDIDGNNLVNGEYYSFIGCSQDKLFMSKNVEDSDVVEYSLIPEKEVEIEPEVSAPAETVEDQVEVEPEVSVPAEAVEDQLEVEPEVSAPAEAVENQVEVEPEVSVPAETVENQVEVEPEVSVPAEIVENQVEVEPEVSAPAEAVDVQPEVELDIKAEQNVQEQVDLPDVSIDADSFEKEIDDTGLELNIDKEDIIEEDPLKDSVVKADKIDYEDSVNEELNTFKDPDIADGTKLFTGLIEQNRKLKTALAAKEEENENNEGKILNLTEIEKMQRQKIEALTEGRKRDRATIIKLQNEAAELEKRANHFERLTSAHEQEIELLRSQVEGKEELTKLFSEARVLLGEDDSLGYDVEDLEKDYYRKVA